MNVLKLSSIKPADVYLKYNFAKWYKHVNISTPFIEKTNTTCMYQFGHLSTYIRIDHPNIDPTQTTTSHDPAVTAPCIAPTFGLTFTILNHPSPSHTHLITRQRNSLYFTSMLRISLTYFLPLSEDFPSNYSNFSCILPTFG